MRFSHRALFSPPSWKNTRRWADNFPPGSPATTRPVYSFPHSTCRRCWPGHKRRSTSLRRAINANSKACFGILWAAAEKLLTRIDWEATDLAIPAMTDTFLGDPGLMLAKFLGNEAASPAARVQEAPLTAAVSNSGNGIIGNWRVSGGYVPFQNQRNLGSVHLAAALTGPSAEFAVDWDRSPHDGRWLLFSETDPNALPPRLPPAPVLGRCQEAS